MTETSTICIETKDVTFTFLNAASTSPPVKVLDGISLSIGSGEFVALLGRSGSGKTTLAKLFNGLLQPTSGVVLINGMDTRDEAFRWEVRRLVGILFQDPDNQIVGTTVAEDVAFGPENLGWPPEKICSMVENALQSVGMAEHGESAPHQLNGLQKLKVSLAGILAMQPACVVVDESAAGLDSSGRAEFMKLLRRLNRESGLTVLFITQQRQELSPSDRAIKLHAGRLDRDVVTSSEMTSC